MIMQIFVKERSGIVADLIANKFLYIYIQFPLFVLCALNSSSCSCRWSAVARTHATLTPGFSIVSSIESKRTLVVPERSLDDF
jgi:hypothetical protein